jgi:predicted nucleic acid-binding protein
VSRYFDTGLLVKMYVPEPQTRAVLSAVRSRNEPLIYTPLHELELKNALRAKQFRREMDAAQVSAAIAAVEEDADNGLLVRSRFDWEHIRDGAEKLSARFTSVTGCRTLDILHVAAARESKASQFLTGDQRQGQLAELAGLKVVMV